jgi:hypothetical protein
LGQSLPGREEDEDENRRANLEYPTPHGGQASLDFIVRIFRGIVNQRPIICCAGPAPDLGEQPEAGRSVKSKAAQARRRCSPNRCRDLKQGPAAVTGDGAVGA